MTLPGRMSGLTRRLAPFMLVAAAACNGGSPTPVAPLPVARATPPAASSGRPVAPPAPLTQELACALPPSGTTRAPASAHPFAPQEPHCPESNPFCDTVDDPPDPRDTCFVASRNIAKAERSMATASPAAPSVGTPWDGRAAPRFLDRIDAHFHLTGGEKDLLRNNGFVVLDRVPYADYASAFHDVFQEELPLYVSIDPILHAVYRGTELVLERIERKRLAPALLRMITKLRSTLGRSRGVYDAVTLGDLDVYLGVASHFVGGEAKSSLFGHDDEVTDLASHNELAPVTLFGRTRMVDFSQLTPRGHYVEQGFADPAALRLDAYFQAVMWLSRLEFNLVSRSCRSSQPGETPDPSETPREARDALALADLVRRSCALAELSEFEQVYSTFAGRREDVTMPDLLGMMQASHFGPGDADAAAKLKAAIGDRFQRTARIHFMPQGSPVLPAIATLFGPRIVPDVAPLTHLVHDSVPGRTLLGAADVGFVLGHDRARELLRDDLAKFPGLDAALVTARGELVKGTREHTDAYATWLRALLAVASPVRGTVPSFMQKDAYRDARMNSALVGYGQLRHTFVLLAGQGYDAYGCEIPDGYVEPLVPVYDALLEHVRRIRKLAGGFDGLLRVLTTLRSIASTEVTGSPLSEPQRRWLGMVSEYIPMGGFVSTGEPPKWTGWYFDMFEDREFGAGNSPAFIADYFTLTNAGIVDYLGAEGPRLGVFVVDTSGGPRAMVGPVAKGYETTSPIDARLDDGHAVKHTPKNAAWRASFAAPVIPEPPLRLSWRFFSCGGSDGGDPTEVRVVAESDRDLGPVSIRLLDHHADPIAPPLTLDVGARRTVYVFEVPAAAAHSGFFYEAMHIEVGDLARSASGTGRYDWFTSPSVFQSKDYQDPALLLQRPRGVGDFHIGAEEAPDPAPAE